MTHLSDVEGVGLIEEISKLLIPLAVLVLVPRYRTRADGLLLDVAVGAGFAALETMGYAFTILVQSKGSVTDTVDVLLLRGVMSPAGHMAWTGIAAAALFAAAASGWQRRGVVEFALAFAVSVILHILWVSLAVLGATVHRAAAQPPAIGGRAVTSLVVG
jgi:RsiW-degrading membrane proteinase PrsW (M82 family)